MTVRLADTPRARQLLLVGGAVLLGVLLWTLAIQPALGVLHQADQRQRSLLAQWREVQSIAQQAEALQAPGDAATPSREASLVALATATQQHLGGQAQLGPVSERVEVQWRGAAPEALAQWLAQVRVNARLQPIEAEMQQDTDGWRGRVLLAGPPLEAR